MLHGTDLGIIWELCSVPKLMLGPWQQPLQSEEEAGLVLHWVVIDPQALKQTERRQGLYCAEVADVVER